MSVKVQKSMWVIVINPPAISIEGQDVEYYKDPRTMGTISTRSPISAEWFDSEIQALTLLDKLKRGKSSKTFHEAVACRMIIGLEHVSS